MRKPSGLRYVVLGMVSQSPDGIHGYALRRTCERALGGFWHLNLSEVYRILDHLIAERLIEQVDGGDAGTRKLYRITDRGQHSLDAFLIARPSDVPRALRHELAVKLLFCGPEHWQQVLESVHHQREVYLRELRRIGTERAKVKRPAGDGFVTSLLIDGVELAVRAELTWLEHVAQKLRERYAPLVPPAMPPTLAASPRHEIENASGSFVARRRRGESTKRSSARRRQLKSR